VANPENIEGQGFHTHPERRHKTGKPKGTRNRSTIVREAIEAILKGTDQQVVDSMTAAIIEKAMGGDVPAFKELMDSAYGKVTDKVEQTGADGKPIAHDVKVQFID